MSEGGHDVHIRLLGCLVKATPHFFAVNGDGWFLCRSGCKTGAKLVKKAYRSMISMFKKGLRRTARAMVNNTPITKLWEFENYVRW
jgi:hypothetical protein